jgi:DNA-binding MarR family transcriptional regulator
VKRADRVRQVRAFNRFYTSAIGVLGDEYLHTRWTVTEARIIFELATNGETTVAGLRRCLDLDRGYLSRIMASFEDSGVVLRDPDLDDARRQRVRLTPAGRLEFKVLNRQSARDIAAVLATHSEGEQAALLSAMSTIRRILGDEQVERRQSHSAPARGFRLGDPASRCPLCPGARVGLRLRSPRRRHRVEVLARRRPGP